MIRHGREHLDWQGEDHDDDGLDTLLAYTGSAFLGICMVGGAIWGGWKLVKALGWL